MKKFSDQINESILKYNLLTTKVFQNACYQVSEDIAMDSPVSTGKLLGQWTPSKNAASSNSYAGGPSAWKFGWKDEGVAEINKGAALSNLLPRIQSVTEGLGKQDTYYFTNDTEYIMQAEYDGWERTPSYHMRANAIQNWQLIVNSAVMALAK
jgi:hypothetical protein